MKQFPKESISAFPSSEKETAAWLMDVVPMLMRHIRAEMRRRGMKGLTLPQFRALIYINRHQGASLSQVAGMVGLALPSVSKLIDGLVVRELVERASAENDRRRVSLSLSRTGRETLARARKGTEARLAEKVAGLSSEERRAVCRAMRSLQAVFGGAEEVNNTGWRAHVDN